MFKYFQSLKICLTSNDMQLGLSVFVEIGL